MMRKWLATCVGNSAPSRNLASGLTPWTLCLLASSTATSPDDGVLPGHMYSPARNVEGWPVPAMLTHSWDRPPHRGGVPRVRSFRFFGAKTVELQRTGRVE